MSKKVFKIDNQDVTSGGVLLYSSKRILLIHSDRGYEDIGGKCDTTDKDIIDTIIRETSEETNNMINLTRSRFIDCEYIITQSSKYCIYLIPALSCELKLDSKSFGTYENHDKIKRTIDWIKIIDFIDYAFMKFNLNPRLFNLKINVFFNNLIESL